MEIWMNRFIRKYSDFCMWIAGIFILAAWILAAVYPAEHFRQLCYAGAMILAGYPIFFRACQGLRFKTVGIELLVSIAVVGASIIGEFSEAAIVTFLFQFGSFLEQKTMKKTRSAIRELTEMAPASAWKINEDTVEEIDADEVEEGDLLLVRTGNQIAADGIVVRGEGYVNEAGITGESEPDHKTAGSTVYAGTFLDSGTLQMKAARVGEDTTFSRIIALVEEAQDAKSPVERFIDRFARYYTPAVVVMAVLVLIVTGNPDTAVTVLVLACPGALVIGAPIANVAGIGRGAREGILLKGGDSIHTFVKTDTVAFDKTGTLTVGQPQVVKEYQYSGERDKILFMAAKAEQVSDHPLARAITAYAERWGMEQNVSAERNILSEPLKGLGVKAQMGEYELLVGNEKLMENYQVEIPEQTKRDLRAEQEQGVTAVLIAVNGKLSMLLVVSDAIREDAASSVRELKKLGIRNLVMLTGDHSRTAASAAAQIGIQEYHGELLPQDKMEWIRKMQKKKHIVTFVGDGINDSPALTAADIGIAMGSGTDVAIDCSEVVLIRSDLTSLVKAWKLAKRTVRIMYQNIAIAVGTVILLLIGLFAGYIHMGIGMLIHEASILVVILNAMRLGFGKKQSGSREIHL